MDKEQIIALAEKAKLFVVRNGDCDVEDLRRFLEAYKAELLNEACEPVADVIKLFDHHGYFTHHTVRFADSYKPENGTKLYTSDQVAAAVARATKPLDDQLAAAQEEIERLKFVHQVAMQLWQVAKGRCDGLEEKLAKAEQRVAEWQPISTAPKDGMRILIKGDCTVVAGWQFIHSADCYGWAIVNDVWMPERIATHWMPLPKAPNGASS